jgi:Na+-transporting methylmalonyl-CoA/oxaloacetate decarboxylase gamma subunit
MATGMGTVVSLLALLVWVVSVVSKVCRWLEPMPVAPVGPPPLASSAADREVLSVIGAAMKAHRDRRPLE